MIGISPAEKTVIGEIIPFSPAAEAGLQPGDEILSMDGVPNYSPGVFRDYASAHAGKTIQLGIQRPLPDGSSEQLTLDYTPILLPKTKPLFEVDYAAGNTVHKITFLPHYEKNNQNNLDSPAKPSRVTVFELPDYPYTVNGSLRIGDTVVRINGESVPSLQAFSKILQKSATEMLTFEIRRDGQATPVVVELKQPDDYKLVPSVRTLAPGFLRKPNMIIVEPTPGEQFVEKIQTTFTVLGSLFNRHSDIGVKDLTGPIGISRVLHRFSIEDLRLALMFTVLLNINLAILNLLPIPVLDGGHMLFATLAKLRGKQLPANFVAGTQGAFMFMLLGLMMYIIFYDTLRWMGDHDYQQRQIQNRAYYLDVVYPKSPESANASVNEPPAK